MELSIPLHITGVRGEKEKKKNQDTGTGFNSIFSISSQDGGSRSSTMGSMTFFTVFSNSISSNAASSMRTGAATLSEESGFSATFSNTNSLF